MNTVDPGRDTTPTVPPCAATIACTTDSPSPTLPDDRVRAESPRVKRSKT